VHCIFLRTGEQSFYASKVKTFEELHFEVFPNPASDKFQIKAKENIGDCTVNITGLQGKKC